MVPCAHNQLSSILELHFLFFFCRILVLIFQDLVFGPYFPICVRGRPEECQTGENGIGQWKEKIPATKSNWLKVQKGTRGVAVRSISDRNSGRQAWRADLAISLSSLRKPLCSGQREMSVVRWRNPSMKSEVDKFSEAEGKNLAESLKSPVSQQLKHLPSAAAAITGRPFRSEGYLPQE